MPPVEIGLPQAALLAALGLGAGLLLFGRGLGAYRDALRVRDQASARIGTLPAGEVRLSGTVAAGALTLVSPLQSRPCVYYRASIVEEGAGDEGSRTLLAEERAVAFFLEDATGRVRVLPGRAEWDVPDRFDERTGLGGDEPAGLERNAGPAVRASEPDREAAVAALLTVRLPRVEGWWPTALGGVRRRRRYREARLEPGETATVVGAALPYRDLADPEHAMLADGAIAADDALVAEEVAEARAAGRLASSPEEAWGNAAIPGFGIGRPTRPPELDAGALPPPPADASFAARAASLFEIEPDELVVAATASRPLAIYAGDPGAAVAREEQTFFVGLLGAVLAIISAVALALLLGAAMAGSA